VSCGRRYPRASAVQSWIHKNDWPALGVCQEDGALSPSEVDDFLSPFLQSGMIGQ
jgi:hypothetical protein